jgi:DNA adenine methylase
MVSYDGVPEVLNLYAQRRSFLYDLQYNAAKAYKGREIFIFSDQIQIPRKSVILSINEALQQVA